MQIFSIKAHDYVNVICGRNSHWDEIGKSQSFQTEVLSCQQNRIVQATLAHRRDLKQKVSEISIHKMIISKKCVFI